MAKVAKETGRATQVSIFNSRTAESRRVIDIVRSGMIWASTSSRYLDQAGIGILEAGPGVLLLLPILCQPGLNWDMWLGPAALRPYNHAIFPLYGAPGTTMAAARSATWGSTAWTPSSVPWNWARRSRFMPVPRSFSRLLSGRLHAQLPFSGEGGKPAVEVHWYDGGIKPARPQGWPWTWT